LRLIAGLDQPTLGTIRLGGNNLAGVPSHRRNVALVFQNLALYSHLTVADNLAFGLNHEGRNKSDSGWAAKLLGIDHLLNRYPAELSGGEQQRVALGRAIVRRPAALLLDEPLSSVDAPARRGLRRELKRLQRQLGMPTIYVTHDQAEAMALGDRIAVLDRGRLQQVGSPGEVYRRPANRFVAEFFGPQGMNWIEGELESREKVDGICGDNVSARIPSKHWPDSLIDGPVVLGIRPEDIELIPATDTQDYSVRGEIELVEMFGETAYAHIRLEIHELLPTTIASKPTTIVARLSNATRNHWPSPGEPVHARFHYDRLHWFGTEGNRMETLNSEL
jgi:ABC-type sugar transport system ATPase subunit